MLMGHGVLNLLGAALLIGFAPVRRYSPMPPEPDSTIPLNCGTEETAVYIDRHRRELGAWSPESFAKVREALLAYRFYPAKTMIRKTQFEEENRAARIGDRLGLGLLPPQSSRPAPGLSLRCRRNQRSRRRTGNGGARLHHHAETLRTGRVGR